MKNQVDMINGPLGNKIIMYAIPVAVTGVLQQLFNAADIAVVGRFAGKEAMAAVGSNSSLVALLVNLFLGISLGSNVVIAKYIGQNNNNKVSKAVHTSIIVAVLGGIGVTLFGLWISSGVIRLLGVPEEVYSMAVTYLKIYLLGMPMILLYNFESAIFRSCGNTRTPLAALVVSGICNVVLNLLFVAGLGMNVAGVAIATVLSNLISSLLLFAALLKTDLVIQIKLDQFRIDKNILLLILKIGVPAGIQGMIFSFANIVIQSAVNSLGTTVIAASSAAYNLEVFAYYVINSFGQACTTFVGQNYGAGKNDRCVKTLKLCYIFAAYTFSFAQETLSGYLRGFGVSFIPALCSVVGICGVRLVWIFMVFQKHPSFTTIMQVYPLSLGITVFAIIAVLLIVKPSKRYR